MRTNTVARRGRLGTFAAALAVAWILAPGAGMAADAADPVAEALSKIKPTIDLRVRYEHADQSGLSEGRALTGRIRLGALSPEISALDGNLQAFFEIEHTEAWDRDSYNAAGIHGPSPSAGSRTLIADPESSEINRAWVSYKAYDSLLKVGRQRIKLDGDRFIGNVGWRQNEQTYDAVSLKNTSVEDLALFYAYVWNVERIFGDDDHLSRDYNSLSHFINVAYSGIPYAKIVAYAYLLDLQNGSGTDFDDDSSDTFGASITGTFKATDDVSLGYYGEYATQEDGGDSTLSYDTDYWHAKGWVSAGGFTFGVGQENLLSDRDSNSTSGGRVGFRTPLATGHKWNGFADQFLTTPDAGLVDTYAYATAKLPWKVVAKAWYHDFDTDSGNDDYGREWNGVLARKFDHGISALLKYANFDAKSGNAGGKVDLRRFWAQIEFKYN